MFYMKNAIFELKLYASDMQMLGKILPHMLLESQAVLEKYQVSAPTLENIFMEVTSNE